MCFGIFKLMPTINWKIAGASGLGIKSIGEVMAKAMSRSGMWIFGYDEYPSLIKGGHNTYQVIGSDEQMTAPRKELDILVALNQDGVELHKDEMTSETKLVLDRGLSAVDLPAKVLSLPILEKAKELGNPIVQNVICLGVSAALMGIDQEIFLELVEEQFGKKKDLLEMNKAAITAGFAMVGDDREETRFRKVEKPRMVLTGTEGTGMGVIAAGVQYYGAYPMTPSTPLLHFLVDNQEEYGYVVRQMEDEIGAINFAVGAAYAGAKVMTGTSGGGFALMQEGVSLAGMLEVPLVVMLGMRPGPATGLPTWTGQGELRFAIHSGHGEFPKIVVAPGDPKEAYELVYKAFEYAQKFQTVVIFLSDKLLLESHYSVESLDEREPVSLMNVDFEPRQPEGEMYHRYQPTPDGVGKRTIPGVKNGYYVANSDEHGPDGLVDETAEMRTVMVRRRLSKLKTITSEMPLPVVYGPEKAERTLIGFGSVKGSVLEAMKQLPNINFIHFTHVWPIPEKVREMLQDRKLIFIENNMMGQFEGLIREFLGVAAEDSIRKDDGRPFYPDEIVNFMRNKR